ncbi:hypothetical protein SASPL_133921 [Salvia splendens]|uniref:Uncharacterized protein n=1 Tax=Salvia splendens TaxID=180675 RepID=A0A8X8X6L6_SALSN|nr:hypothetical protein SASPL_133921 [Salvia splendens]
MSEAPVVVREVDPLLKDLSEKKQSFRRNVVSLAAELKEVRSRLASQEQSVEAETKLKKMEKEICQLEKSLEEKNAQLQASNTAAEMYVKEMDDLRLQLSLTSATADASALSAQSAQMQCSALVKELDEKNCSLIEHKTRVDKLREQLDLLQKDLLAREVSQMQLKDEVSKIEHEITEALTKAGADKDCELWKILDETFMSAHWKLKTKELECQLEKHRRADLELKKKVLKLEFCLQEARVQTRKLQRMGERRDKTLNELRDQLAAKEHAASSDKHNFWESSGFKIAVSMSMLVLVMFSKR